MTDTALLRILVQNFSMGAALGGLFFGALLIFNIQRFLEVIQSSAAPWTTAIILSLGCCFSFAFGAMITGFHFAIMEGDPDRRS